MEVDEEEEKNPFETLLIQDIKEGELNTRSHANGEIVNI